MSLLHQVALTFIKKIGPTLAKSPIAHFGDAEQVFKTSKAKLLRVPGIGEKTFGGIDFTSALLRAEEELRFIDKNEVKVIFYTDKSYPKRLKNCADGPILLYAKGNMELNPQHVISIGTRNATDYGKQLCRQLVEELQQYNALIVSGLALGIDVCAHKESLKQNLPTVGVLGHGLDRMYPAQNRSTADKMLENGRLLTGFLQGRFPTVKIFRSGTVLSPAWLTPQ
jgi:DNA processing protein